MSNSTRMKQGEDAFRYLMRVQFKAAKLRHAPYGFAFAESAIDARFKDEVLADAPRIPDRERPKPC